MARKDRITLEGIRMEVRIGTTPEERRTVQTCEADLTVWGDFQAAAASDALDQSIDYIRLLERVRELAGAREYCLVESLAYTIVRSVVRDFAVQGARIQLRKRPQALEGQIRCVEIEVEAP